MPSYEQRTLQKANFLLNKFKLAYKRYPNYTSFFKWLESSNITQYPFKYDLKQPSASSSSNGGHLTPVISIGQGGKKSRKRNLAGVLSIKNEVKKLFGKEPTLDQLSTGIALFTIHIIIKPHLYKPKELKPPPHLALPPASKIIKIPIIEVKPPTIIMPEVDSDDDWESLC